MKKLSFLILGFVLLSSCNSTYYQIYKVSPADHKVKEKNNGLIYEDSNCIVTYNLWGENGDFSFTVYNKSNDPIYIHLDESFYVNNNKAFDYYKNREFSSSRGTTVSSSNTKSETSSILVRSFFGLPQVSKTGNSKTVQIEGLNSSSISQKEEPVITIPPQTYKNIEEYTINSLIYRDCDLFLYPNRNQINTLNFNESNSPIVLSNRINYTVGKSTTPIHIENTFYISEISNYPEKEITETRSDEICDQKLISPKQYIKNSGPDKFYVKYSKSGRGLKH